jgi:hypothetical protein
MVEKSMKALRMEDEIGTTRSVMRVIFMMRRNSKPAARRHRLFAHGDIGRRC